MRPFELIEKQQDKFQYNSIERVIEMIYRDYKFKTIAYTDSPISDGVINGNLYLKGFGDPDLYSGDISVLAKDVAQKVKQLNGNIIYDNSFLDDNYYSLANF